MPIDIAPPLPFAKAAQSMLERTFAACEADAACGSAFPSVRDEFFQEGESPIHTPGLHDPGEWSLGGQSPVVPTILKCCKTMRRPTMASLTPIRQRENN